MFKKNDICIFIGHVVFGKQFLERTKYIGHSCRVVNTYNDAFQYYKVVFINDNGNKYYTKIGKDFLILDKKQMRKLKLEKL